MSARDTVPKLPVAPLAIESPPLVTSALTTPPAKTSTPPAATVMPWAVPPEPRISVPPLLTVVATDSSIAAVGECRRMLDRIERDAAAYHDAPLAPLGQALGDIADMVLDAAQHRVVVFIDLQNMHGT